MVFMIGFRSAGSFATMVCTSNMNGLNSREVFVNLFSSDRTLSHSTGSEMSVPSMSKTQNLAFASPKGLEHLLLRPVVLSPKVSPYVHVPEEVVPVRDEVGPRSHVLHLSLIHISEPTRLGMISYAVFC